MAGLSSNSFETGSNTGVCAATGRELAPGEVVVGALTEQETGDLVRLDYSKEAWESGERPGPELTLIGSWRTIVPQPGKPRDPLVGAGALMELFEQLEEATEPRRVAFRYALALILIRKKELRLEGGKEREDGGRSMLVRARGVAPPPARGGDGPPLIEVTDPNLDEAAVAGLVEDLGAVLSDEALD